MNDQQLPPLVAWAKHIDLPPLPVPEGNIYPSGIFGYTADQMHAYARAALEQLRCDSAQGVPAGWKLVPVEPTPEMICRGQQASFQAAGSTDWCAHTYRAMLAATPAPAQAQQAGRTGATYYKNDACKAANADAADCICWTPAQAQQAAPLTGEQRHAIRGTGGIDVLELAKLWAANKVHTYQVVNEAEKIIDAAVDRALGIGASSGGTA